MGGSTRVARTLAAAAALALAAAAAFGVLGERPADAQGGGGGGLFVSPSAGAGMCAVDDHPPLGDPSAPPSLQTAQLSRPSSTYGSVELDSAEAALRAGNVVSARRYADAALAAADSPVARARAQGVIGVIEAVRGNVGDATAAFQESVNLARAQYADDVVARSSFNLALLQTQSSGAQLETPTWFEGLRLGDRTRVARREYVDVVEQSSTEKQLLAEAAAAAERAGDAQLAARAYAQLAAVEPDQVAAVGHLRTAASSLGRAEYGAARSETALGIADAALVHSDSPDAQRVAYTLLAEALDEARSRGDARIEAYSRGLLARLYADTGRYQEALGLVEQALFLSDAAALQDQFVWHGLRAALLERIGDTNRALNAYERAVAEIDEARPALASASYLDGRGSYRQVIEPILLAYADLLLRSGERDATRILQAREVVDSLKTLEFEQYFQDACVSRVLGQSVELEDVPSRAAVLYPIMFDDRVELIVTIEGQIERRSARISRDELEAQARLLRRSLQDRSSQAYLAPAQRLYDVLIRPISDLLDDDVTTLVFAPDGALRGAPISALHDGERFVIERWSVATVAGLALVDPRPLDRVQRRAIVAGVSESVQGYPALPSVASEVSAIGALMPGPTLVDGAFTEAALSRALAREPFTIAHLATHAQFGRSAEDSFLVAYDGQIALDELGELMSRAQVRGAPIELLTLSACETAAGDDRAILGLAGVAYRSGARSVLASLWSIPDASTAELTPEFYRALIQEHTSKAEALRRAQLHLLADEATAHPYYWSAFVLVGNWL